MEPGILTTEANRLVTEDADAVGGQCTGHRAMEVPVAAEAEGVAHGKIMVAQDRKHPVGSAQTAQWFGHGVDIPVTAVNEVACQHHEVRSLGLRQIYGLAQIRRGDLPATVKVGELSDAEAGKRRRQIPYGNFEPVQL